MTLDHMGLMLFPHCEWMRIIGRIAFPIFAFMIAEGCEHTRNRRKYLLQIAILGVGMQIVYLIATASLYQSVFISFTLAIILIYLIDMAKSSQQIKYRIYVAIAALTVIFLCLGLPRILYRTDYEIDYGIIGILIPIACYFVKDRKLKLLAFSLCLVALSATYGGNQWYCLLTIPLIGLYNYQRGKIKLKYLFYFYYPIHLLVIYAIKMFFKSQQYK